MIRRTAGIVVLLVTVAPAPPCGAWSFEADFRHDPVSAGEAVVSGEAARFLHRRSAPLHPGEAPGSLRAAFDSSLPTARLEFPLPGMLTEQDAFRLRAVLTLRDVEASPEDFMQIAFGLLDGASTGLNRTGTFPLFHDADTWNLVELSYFPNVTAFGGPTLTPAVFGPDSGLGSPYFDFAAVFGPAADLGDNLAPEVNRLPEGVPLEIVLENRPCDRSLVLSVADLSTGRPVPLPTGVPPLDLSFVSGFEVDTVAILAWKDAADFDPSTVSLRAAVEFDALGVETLGDGEAARVTPEAWNPGRGGDLVARLEGAVAGGSLRLVEVAGTRVSLAGEPVGTGGGGPGRWRFDGEAISGLLPGGAAEIGLVFERGCRLLPATLRIPGR